MSTRILVIAFFLVFSNAIIYQTKADGTNLAYNQRHRLNCFELFKVVGKDSINRHSIIKIINDRAQLKRKYQRVIQSVDDFNPLAHPPIQGLAKLIADPVEGFLAKIMMIRKAKSTIDVSYYIFKQDQSGDAILNELRKAVKRGVQVRILLDSSGSITNAPLYANIQALTKVKGGRLRDSLGRLTNRRASVNAVVFNPIINLKIHVVNWYRRMKNVFIDAERQLPIITTTINRRSHDKILLVDAFDKENSMAIIGGRNIANYYYGLGEDVKKTYEDLEIAIKNIAQNDHKGELKNVLGEYYNKIFYFMANRNLRDFLFKIRVPGFKRHLRQMRRGSQDLLFDSHAVREKLIAMENENYLENGFDEGLISIVDEIQNISRRRALLRPEGAHNKINGNSLVKRFRAEMAKAKNTIDIVSPYIYLTDNEIEFLKQWVSKDPSRRVRIISNSISTTDNIPAQAMVDTIIGPKLVEEVRGEPFEKQMQVYAYGKLDAQALGGETAYGKLHGKYFIVDDRSIVVGTSNLDPRSRNLNTEIGVHFSREGQKESALIDEMKSYTDELVEKSVLWGSDEWQAIRNHKNSQTSVKLQWFVGKIIHWFNLVPLI